MSNFESGYTGKRTISWKVSDELNELLEVVAKYEDRSKSAVIRRAVLAYLHAGSYLDPSQIPEMVSHVARDSVEDHST